MEHLVARLVPDNLWKIAAQLIHSAPKRKQGGGIARADDRIVLAAVVFVLSTGCSWRQLPNCFGVSHQTAHRRFSEWTQASLWTQLVKAAHKHLADACEIEWSHAIADAAASRRKSGTIRPFSPPTETDNEQ